MDHDAGVWQRVAFALRESHMRWACKLGPHACRAKHVSAEDMCRSEAHLALRRAWMSVLPKQQANARSRYVRQPDWPQDMEGELYADDLKQNKQMC